MRILSSPSLTLIDQGICSVSTFAVFAILAQFLVQEDFAAFSLIFSAVMFLLGFQNALITMPLRVFGVGDSTIEKISSNSNLFLVFTLSLALISFVVACFFLPFRTAVLVPFLLASQLLYEFVKVRFYLLKSYIGLCFFDLQIHGFRAVCILSLMATDLLTLETALILISLSYFLSLYFFLSDSKTKTESFKVCLARNWNFGRWLIIENVSVNVSQRYYLFVVAAILNEGIVAGLSCLQSLMNMVNVFVMGLSGYLLQQSRDHVKSEQLECWIKFLLYSFLVVLGGVAIILLVINLWSDILLGHIYGEYYKKFSDLIPFFSIAYFLLSFNSLANIVFRSLEDSISGMLVKTFGAFVLILVISPMIKHFGAQGAIMTLILTQVLWAFGFIILFLRKYDRKVSVFFPRRTLP
jgi:O-antigen/teichoic acid export membrane protein